MAARPSLVVGLGASAVGIQAMRAFFGEVPEKSDMAFVVVTHLSPDRESLIHEVIRGFRTLSVEVIKDGDPVQAGTALLMAWMPPPIGIVMCHCDVSESITQRESIHVRS